MTPDSDGYIVIENTGDNLLSITKLRTTGSGSNGVVEISDQEATDAATRFMTAEYVPYTSETVDVEGEDQNQTETPDVETPETEESGDVTIDNPEDYESPENGGADQEQTTTSPSIGHNWISNLFNSIKNLFSRW